MKLTSLSTATPRGGASRAVIARPRPCTSTAAAPTTAAPTTAAPTTAPTWAAVEAAAAPALAATAYTTRPEGLVPASSPNPALPTPSTGPGPAPASTAPILFARDTHGWCPFAQRVWLALTHIGAPFEVVFIDLRAKPDWYPAVVPTSKVPALFLASPDQLAGGAAVPVAERELVYESLDILARLDADFPGKLTPPGTDGAAAAAALGLADKFGTAGYGLVRSAAAAGGAAAAATPPAGGAQAPPPPPLSEAKAAFEAVLEEWEALLASTPGPFLAGPAVSLADFALAPMAERLAATVPASPLAGTAVRGRADKPLIDAWYAAMEAVPAYKAVRGDPATHRTVFRRVMGQAGLQAPPYVPADADAAKEAAAKLSANRAAVVLDACKNAGVPAGSEAAVEAALLRVAHCLTSGLPGPAAEEASDNAVTAAVAAFLPARVSAPRDMSGGAATELRAACMRVAAGAYTGL